MSKIRGHKQADWMNHPNPPIKLKRKGANSDGSNQARPKHGRKTVTHKKHVGFPGMRKQDKAAREAKYTK